MIVRQTFQILRNFGRLIKPKISKVDNVFELMKDKSGQLAFIQNYNNQLLTKNKYTSYNQIISRRLGLSQNKSQQLTNSPISDIAYSPIWMRPYRIRQKLNHPIEVEDGVEQLETPYHPTNINLKFHYSINKDVPIIQQYHLDKSSAYIFNLPKDITEKQLTMQLGYRIVKNVKIKYCQLGLPAFAKIQFNSDNNLAQKFIGNHLQINIEGRTCFIVTQANKHKLQLNRRQLVLKGLEEHQTPAQMLQTLSSFGRVMNLNYPIQVYRQPSLKQIKQLYKNQKYPICINYHRKNGTIERQYYPPYETKSIMNSNSQKKQNEYKRMLRYSENVHVYEGKQGTVSTKSKGFCIVTYSCQQQAQNCYLHLRANLKMQVLNGRQQFQFDEKHRMALLRFIDNSYIQKCLQLNPSSQIQKQEKKLNSDFYQDLLYKTIYEEYKQQNYYNQAKLRRTLKSKNSPFSEQKMHYLYKKSLTQLKDSIGISNLNKNPTENNQYGKSFDQLAQQQLYGFKLKDKANRKRYEVNIDDYIKQQSIMNKLASQRRILQFSDQRQSQVSYEDDEFSQFSQTNEAQIAQMQDAPILDQQKKPQKQQDDVLIEEKQKIQKTVSKVKKGFSTLKNAAQMTRPKTLEQKVKSHINYNKYVRDLINEYMGIFPTSKLEQQFYRRKATFTNPQNLRFSDGTDFLTQDEVKNVLEFSTVSAQQFYTNFVKQNQIAKSLNIDIEEQMLKNFDDNQSNALQYYTDVGVVKQEFQYDGEQDIQTVVKKLNRQAQFGQQYRVAQNQNENKRIVKIAKLQNIYPLNMIQKLKKGVKNIQNDEDHEKKQLMLQKYIDYISNGQPIPDEMAETFGLQKGSVINPQKISEQICQQFDINKKDLQKLFNLGNYSVQQIQQDIGVQIKVSKARQKLQATKASDYSRDTSQIKVKGRNKRSIVSKFRQI